MSEESFRTDVQIEIRISDTGLMHVRCWNLEHDWSGIVPNGADPWRYARRLTLTKFPVAAAKASPRYEGMAFGDYTTDS